ncbi:endocuticle structural glycoprotein SgAbd-5-like [Condylostylus longicornis]|uniref:endocuticle structural glycoprotein SgAbd-5-like n=1 Tax=Condylostylus longicornis TaxID=2530218 RepID=UPI00244E40A2|nr:endocuticle structural glycoprotein SgAbd-5-like [Condylostylus longicornis]
MNRLQMSLILLTTLIVTVLAYPQKEEIVLYESDVDDKGYNFQYETSDGIARIESGKLKPDSEGGESISVEGTYTYTDDRGEQHTVKYIADEKGFRLKP